MFYQRLSGKNKVKFKIGVLVDRLNKKQVLYHKIMDQYAERAKMRTLGFQVEEDERELTLTSDDQTIFLRKRGSDKDVFEQILVKNEYSMVTSIMLLNKVEPKLIVDAGSNIGLTTIKLMEAFPECSFFCIEPDPQNFQQLKRNLNHAQNCTLLENALWNRDEALFIDADFLDGKDWSRSVSQKHTSELKVQGISMSSLIRDYNIDLIDLLKIDIEGSEYVVFGSDSDISFLKKVKVLAMEIHDSVGCRQQIYDTLRSNNFVLLNSGELTIALNKGLT